MSNKGQMLQDPFLNTLRKEHVQVSIYLVNGIKLQGQIESFDQYVVLVPADMQAHDSRRPGFVNGTDDASESSRRARARLTPSR